LPLGSSRQAKATADPLDNVLLFGAVQAGMQQGSVLGSYQRHALAAQQQHLLRAQQHMAGQRQQQQLPTVNDGSILVVPQQNGNGLPNGSKFSSKALPVPQEEQQQQFVEQQDNSSLQEQQQQQGPAPYVLGTWAQRQFIMPLNKAKQKADEAAAVQQGAAAPGTSLAQPIPANGRWPSSGSSGYSSTGSKASRGSGKAAAAAVAAVDADGAAADTTAAAAAGDGQLSQVHGSNAAALAAAAAAAAAVEEAVAQGRRSMGTDDEEEAVQQAAWRWRFAKRWQAEQTRPPADHAASVGDGGMEEALQYLAACGENWHLARATSIDPASESRLLGTLGTPSLLSAELLVDESFSAHGSGRGGLLQSTGSDVLGSGCLSREASCAGANGHHQHGHGGAHHAAGRGGGEATQQVTGITKRAAQLLAAQSDINNAVTQR
jgi:hypothetical protein